MLDLKSDHKFKVTKQNTYAKNGMVATSSPLAALAGLEILKRGGNAVDAAIATAIALTVVEPTSNGMGGDSFALVYDQNQLHGLNSSGYAPKTLSIEMLKSKGYNDIPKFGAIPITVPGAVASWKALSDRFGKLPFEDLFGPAINYAEEGFIVTDYVAKHWQNAAKIYAKEDAKAFKPWFDTFTNKGKAPIGGELWKQTDQAKTLKVLAQTGCEDYYRGQLAAKIAAHLQSLGGFLSEDDLRNFKPEWVHPISINYRGYDIFEIPPNGQGVSALMALNILSQFNLEDLLKSKDVQRDTMRLHLEIESMKQAFTDVKACLADPKFHDFPLSYYLSESYGKSCSSEIDLEVASLPYHKPEPTGGTVYLCTADADGQMVSFIQSNYMGFGSGIVIPGTGISMHNRGHNFSFDPNHPNALEPLKRPYHTIIPGFIMKDNLPLGPFGVMGGFMQPQGHLQVISNLIDLKMSPQEAINAPRWQWLEDKNILIEDTFDQNTLNHLLKKGHHVSIADDNATFGRGQMILKIANGSYIGGTEMRCDGYIALY